MSIKATIIGDIETINRIKLISSAVTDSVARQMMRCAIMVQRRVKEKLSGPVLKVQTGSLRSSIHAEVKAGRNSILGVVGTNIKYAGIHEYGGMGGRYGTAKYPERSFLRSSLKELTPEIKDLLKKDAIKTVKTTLKK